MKNLRSAGPITLAIAMMTIATLPAHAHTEDDPLLTKVMLDLKWQPEQNQHQQALEWDAEAWVGKDLHKLWLKTKGDMDEEQTEESQAQLLYGFAISPYWDALVGWRHDFEPLAEKDWLTVGMQGLAPYFVETEVALFVDDKGDTAATLELERELMITQKWALAPHIEAEFYGQNDAVQGLGSGLATLEAGIDLRYEIRREFAPFIGINWERAFGNTADYRHLAEGHVTERHWVVGLHAWY